MNADRTFRALADETRLRIVHLLAKGELCVCDLMAVLRVPQSKVSRHLGYLKRAGLVADRREGFWRHYSLGKPAHRLQARTIAGVKDCFRDVPVLAADAKRFAAYRKKSRRCD
ncbi:MAG TPA: metalloregulator ArsR/SmtB family transcription factor [Elusimicrobiota bacterium]|nr:metalloregulator ArsR/SmtB family transcription factor [Elusimicrobiota bacterium]